MSPFARRCSFVLANGSNPPTSPAEIAQLAQLRDRDIPSGVGAERHRHFGQPDACDVVAVAFTWGTSTRYGAPSLRRLVGDHSRGGVAGAVVHPPHLRHIGRERERRRARESGRPRAPPARPSRSTGYCDGGGSLLVARPGIEIEEQRTRDPSLFGKVDEVLERLTPRPRPAGATRTNAACRRGNTAAMSAASGTSVRPSSLVWVSDPARAQYSVDENV